MMKTAAAFLHSVDHVSSDDDLFFRQNCSNKGFRHQMCIFPPSQVIFSKLITGPECLQLNTNFTLLPPFPAHTLFIFRWKPIWYIVFFSPLHSSPAATKPTIASDKLIIGTSRRPRRCLTNDTQIAKTTISEQT